MNIQCRTEETVTIASLSGRLDSATSTPALTQLMASVEHAQPRLILDVEALEYVSSAGLRALLGIAKKVRAAGGKIAIVAMKDHIREIYEISGFQSVIPPYPDVASARATLLQ